jgi:hypothetical protein
MVLGIISLIISIVSLVISIIASNKKGKQGLQGPQGPMYNEKQENDKPEVNVPINRPSSNEEFIPIKTPGFIENDKINPEKELNRITK